MYTLKWKYFLFNAILLMTVFNVHAQEITLEECYNLARENYPAVKKLDLVAKSGQFSIANANKQYLPQLTFSGQATYQSETIDFSEAIGSAIPNIKLPTISKDQYKIQGEVDQQLYDGGSVKYQKDLIKANTDLQQQNLEVSLYALRDRVDGIYFSILLIDAELQQIEINKSNLQTQIEKTRAAFNNGTAYKSNVDELDAEITNTDISTTEYKANRDAYLKVLAIFIGKDLPPSTQLVMPESPNSNITEINRPELKAYEYQKAVYVAQKEQLKADYLPKFSAFFQGAYGRPTLNIIDNQFGPWYITGVRLNWSLGSLYTLKNQKRILNLNQLSVDADNDVFLLNTKLDLAQEDEDVKKYSELILKDERMITFRESVTKSAAAQLENGVTTTHEYVQQLNAENLARQNLILHRIQLLQARYNQKYKSGN